MDLKEIEFGLDLYDSRSVLGSCEDGSEPSGSVKIR
jgi:hypothetical protein